MSSLVTAEQVKAPKADAIEVLLTLSPGQYAEMGEDIDAIRQLLDLPRSASPQQVIIEALQLQAGRK